MGAASILCWGVANVAWRGSSWSCSKLYQLSLLQLKGERWCRVMVEDSIWRACGGVSVDCHLCQLEPGQRLNFRVPSTCLGSMCKHTLTNESQEVRVWSMTLDLVVRCEW